MIQRNSLARQTLDTLPLNIAVLDDDGTILFTNAGWNEFYGVGPSEYDDFVGVNYFDSVATETDEYASKALVGLQAVIDGERDVFTLEYPCHTPDQKQWFTMRAVPLPDHDEASVVVAHLDITQRKLAEIETREKTQHLEHLMSRIDGLISEVMEGVLQADTRAEIEQTVCERLVAVGSYACAWVGRVDLRTDTLTAAASTCDHREPVAIDLAGNDPAVKAVESGETQVVQDTANATLAAVHENTLLTESGALASFPLVYGDSQYGSLTVATTDAGAFDARELAVLDTLSRTVSTAINAIEGRRIIGTDSVIEMELAIGNEGLFFGDLSAAFDCRLTYEGSLYEEDGSVVMLFAVKGVEGTDLIEASRAHEGIQDATIVSESEDGSVIEFRVAEPPLVAELAERGAETTAITAHEGETRITLELPASADPRSIIEQLAEQYPSTDLVARREQERSGQTKQELVADIENRLTDRQRMAIQKAYLGGFFDWPRTISGEDLAESMDISPSTYHQHLRTAERKVLAVLFEE